MTPTESLFVSTFSFSYADSDGRIVTVTRTFKEGAQVGQVAALFMSLLRAADYGVEDVTVSTGLAEFSATDSY